MQQTLKDLDQLSAGSQALNTYLDAAEALRKRREAAEAKAAQARAKVGYGDDEDSVGSSDEDGAAGGGAGRQGSGGHGDDNGDGEDDVGDDGEDSDESSELDEEEAAFFLTEFDHAKRDREANPRKPKLQLLGQGGQGPRRPGVLVGEGGDETTGEVDAAEYAAAVAAEEARQRKREAEEAYDLAHPPVTEAALFQGCLDLKVATTSCELIVNTRQLAVAFSSASG